MNVGKMRWPLEVVFDCFAILCHCQCTSVKRVGDCWCCNICWNTTGILKKQSIKIRAFVRIFIGVRTPHRSNIGCIRIFQPHSMYAFRQHTNTSINCLFFRLDTEYNISEPLFTHPDGVTLIMMHTTTNTRKIFWMIFKLLLDFSQLCHLLNLTVNVMLGII